MTGQSVYIGGMTQILKGPVATEIEARLRDALNPQQLAVIDDSEKHRGHAGHDGSGESHFTVEIIADRGIDVDHLFTHHWRLDQAAEAYNLFDSQTTGKGVIHPS